MHKLAALALLATLILACDKGDSTSSGDASSGSATESSNSNSDSNATEVSGGTDGDSDAPTTANSVTTPPMTDPTGPTSDPTGDPTGETQGQTVTSAGEDPDESATQLCVDTINTYRATLGLAPLSRWTDAETCSDEQAASDGASGSAHEAFGMCGESAQNECPGWPGPPESMITGCLDLMWAEGPGEDFNKHGHYINMSSTSYTKVACGFADGMNGVWSVQNFQ